jgi:hypothetical protein
MTDFSAIIERLAMAATPYDNIRACYETLWAMQADNGASVRRPSDYLARIREGRD